MAFTITRLVAAVSDRIKIKTQFKSDLLCTKRQNYFKGICCERNYFARTGIIYTLCNPTLTLDMQLIQARYYTKSHNIKLFIIMGRINISWSVILKCVVSTNYIIITLEGVKVSLQRGIGKQETSA